MNRRFWFCSIALVAIVLLTNIPHSQPTLHQENMTLPPTPSQSLAEQAGFSSPVLDDFERQGMRWVNENIAFTAYGHDYRLLGFLPTGVSTSDGNMPALGAAMLFQVDQNVGKLLWRKNVGSEWTILDSVHSEGLKWPKPDDWEKNGQVDFAILNVADRTCPFSLLNMFVLSSDGTVSSRLKNIIPLDHVVSSIEIQENGKLLLTAKDERGESMGRCVYPEMIQYFELDGTKLVDISIQHQQTYMEMLGEAIYFTTTWKSLPQMSDDDNSGWYSTYLMEMLLIYDELGQRDAGYHLVQNLATDAIKTGQIKPNTYLDQIFLPDMAQLYQQNQPFIEPAYIGPKVLQQVNYYP